MDWSNELSRMANDWPAGTLAFVVLALCALALLGMILWGVFISVDSWSVEEHIGTGQVLQKQFEPEHMVTEYNPALKMPMVRRVDDEWSLLIGVGESTDWASVEKRFYDRYRVGDSLTVSFIYGRISGSLYIKALAEPT